jgi:hypothetical protein
MNPHITLHLINQYKAYVLTKNLNNTEQSKYKGVETSAKLLGHDSLNALAMKPSVINKATYVRGIFSLPLSPALCQ